MASVAKLITALQPSPTWSFGQTGFRRPPGQIYNSNRSAIGIYLIYGFAAQLDRNAVTGMLNGIFICSGARNYVGKNNCSTNMNFGIHITGSAKSFLLEGNTCNYNGGILSPTY